MSIPRSRVGLKPGRGAVETGVVAADPLDPFAADSLEREQERAVRRLRESYAAGAFGLDELTRRIAAVYAARTAEDVGAAAGRAAGAGDAALEPHLAAGEQVLWTGRPDASKRLTKTDLVAVPFSVAWGGFAIFWEVSVIVSGAPIFFWLWGVPFVAIGLYLIFGRFVYRSWLRRRTLYAITDRRVVKLVRRRSGDSVEALFLDAIPAVNRELRRDGGGTVLFGTASLQARANALLPVAVAKVEGVPLMFEDIPDAAYVAELVTDLRRT
jgi:hypothetical protein